MSVVLKFANMEEAGRPLLSPGVLSQAPKSRKAAQPSSFFVDTPNWRFLAMGFYAASSTRALAAQRQGVRSCISANLSRRSGLA
jgi:hypothetical protein